MTVYNISAPVNGTDTGSSTVGLSVGLTFFFVLLVVGTGVIVYIFRSKMRNMLLRFGQRKSQKSKNCEEETSQEDSNRYASMTKEEPTGQQPIYINLSTTREQSKPAVKRRSPIEPEEDVYLQCDSPDDAIYNNDPACHLSIHQEDDIYIIPES